MNGNYTTNALLYQNILECFSIHEEKREQKKVLRIEPEYFTTWNLTKWLLKKNLEFAKYYSGLSRYMPTSAKISNRLGTVEEHVNDLVKLNLLNHTGFEEASKNRTPIAIYRISNFGVIVLLVMRYTTKGISEETRIRLRQMILELIQQYMLLYDSHICDFIARLYSKAIRIGFSKSIVDLLLMIIHGDSHTMRTLVDVFNKVLIVHLNDKRTWNYFVDIWINTLKEFPENVQRIIIYHEKAEIESRIHLSQPPKEWEETWLSNIQNYSQLVLYGKCSQCSKKYPVIIDYYEYRREIFSDGSMKRNCLKCNAENSMVIRSEIYE
jgi:hypothetical protein